MNENDMFNDENDFADDNHVVNRVQDRHFSKIKVPNRIDLQEAGLTQSAQLPKLEIQCDRISY
jgi:hypothetical protein